jgi:hypothetical protein
MTAHPFPQPNEFSSGLEREVARIDERQKADHEVIVDIGKKIDRVMFGVISVLLIVIGQLIFKH